jgi:hypothetical protein
MPFPFETLEGRRQRLILAVGALRNALSDADWRVLEEARLRNHR